jgi:hypothetical protein
MFDCVIRGKIRKCARKNGIYGVNVEITAISDIFKESGNVYLVPVDKITQPPTIIYSHSVTKKKKRSSSS